jgi:hypothetical protein
MFTAGQTPSLLPGQTLVTPCSLLVKHHHCWSNTITAAMFTTGQTPSLHYPFHPRLQMGPR